MRAKISKFLISDFGVLALLALGRLALHTLTNGQYGFHRDELAMLDNARHLAWGYVETPPLTAFIVRAAYELFGGSLVGLRLPSAVAQSIAMLLTGLMARELGGGRRAQVVAALAAAMAPMSLIMGAMFQYISFDYLWWVLAAYVMLRLIKSEDRRWWLALGVVLGLGMLTKNTIAFMIAGIVAGVLLTSLRNQLKSPWLWGGAALSVLIFLPNLLWQVQHDFISLEFLSSIHARDIAIGRADGFLAQQLFVSANLFTLPLWIAGLVFYFYIPDGRRYRLMGFVYLVALVGLMLARGRFYYLAPAYPALLAAGAVVEERYWKALPKWLARFCWRQRWWTLAAGAVFGATLMLPVWPVGSPLWKLVANVHDNFSEQVGWQELVETVAGIYEALPEDERLVTGILARNFGEAGAINLYGVSYGLPTAISGVNSYWLRGFGDPPPQIVIVLGSSMEQGEGYFENCELAGQVSNRYGIENEETLFHPDIFICRRLLQPWSEFWPSFRWFG